MAVAMVVIRNLLVIPVSMIYSEKSIFLLYLVLSLLFFKLVTTSLNLNLDLVVGETISSLVKSGISNVYNMKSWDMFLLVKDRFIYSLRLIVSYYLSSLIKNKRLFFVLLLLLLL